MERSGPPIRDVCVLVADEPLVEPIVFGEWRITHRRYVVVAAIDADGRAGFAMADCRGAPVAEAIVALVRRFYAGAAPADAPRLFDAALAANPATLASGVGLRALSLVDIATWDLAAKQAGAPGRRLLSSAPAATLVATAIAGYPPAASADRVREECADLAARGWRRIKLPIAPSRALTLDRLRAAAASGAVVGLDAAWTFRDGAAAAEFAREAGGLGLSWIEDPFLPGDVEALRAFRSRSDMTVAIGDEQPEAWLPELLAGTGLVDVFRLDAGAMGGVTRMSRIAPRLAATGVRLSSHAAGELHTEILLGLGIADAEAEWAAFDGGEGLGVAPRVPRIVDGRAGAVSDDPGFGVRLPAVDWMADHLVLDDGGLVAHLAGGA